MGTALQRAAGTLRARGLGHGHPAAPVVAGMEQPSRAGEAPGPGLGPAPCAGHSKIPPGHGKIPPTSTWPRGKLGTGPGMRLKALGADLWPDTFTAAAVRDYCEHQVPAQGELLLHLAANYCQGPRLEQITVQPALCLGLVLRQLP